MINVRSLFLVLLFMTVETATHGQTNKFEFGMEGGPSLIFLRGNDVIKQFHKPAAGFAGGLSFQYNFRKIISLRTNIAYERKGSVLTTQVTDMNGLPFDEITTHMNLDYLVIPILVRATFGKNVHYFVNVGQYFGYLINQAAVSQGDFFDTKTIDHTSLFKRFDTGVSTGLGISVPIGNRFAVSFEVRNNFGLYNVSTVPAANNGKAFTNSTNFLFGLAHKFGERRHEFESIQEPLN